MKLLLHDAWQNRHKLQHRQGKDEKAECAKFENECFSLASFVQHGRITLLSRNATFYYENSYYPPPCLLLAYFKHFTAVGVLAAAALPCALAQQYIQPVSVVPGQAFQLGNVTYVPATSGQTVVPVQQAQSQMVPVSVPTVAPAPTITQMGQENKSSFSVEITGSYNFATRRIYSGYIGNGPEVNTTGVDLTFLYHINPKNAITFRVGYSFGSDDEVNTVYAGYGRYIDYNLDFEISNLYFMPGYRGETAISDSTSLFWGFNLGIVSQHVKATETVPSYGSDSISASEVGFAYSVEVGANIRLSPNAGIVMAAILSGSTAEPSEDGEKIKQQILNPGLRLGIAISF